MATETADAQTGEETESVTTVVVTVVVSAEDTGAAGVAHQVVHLDRWLPGTWRQQRQNSRHTVC